MITLVNPNLVLQQNDMFTTGVVYMPIGLASFAGVLRNNGIKCAVIDTFGESPNQWMIDKGYLFRGITATQLTGKISRETDAIVLYAINLTYHRSIINIIQEIKHRFPETPLIVMENTQAVTAYALSNIIDEMLDMGVDYVVVGEIEEHGLELIKAIQNNLTNVEIKKIEGIGFRDKNLTIYTKPKRKIENLDNLPLPAWDLFPLENYWKLKYAHGPFETDKYLPILTSRGCPYGCRFCVIPTTNEKNGVHVQQKMLLMRWRNTFINLMLENFILKM